MGVMACRRTTGLGAAMVSDGARLAALRELEILDTEPEGELDRFTALAAELLEVPISLVSLVDLDRQFFKSAHGLPEPLASVRETPLDRSLCQQVVIRGAPLLIDDTREHPLGIGNPAVQELSVLAYAGVPLTIADGHAIGAFCAIDTTARQWTERDMRILTDLASAVETILELRRSTRSGWTHDPLTGLPNRGFTFAWADQLARSRADRDVLAVAVGIDGLRAINETHGAGHGDRVVALVARRLRHALTAADFLGRVDGDVFVALHPPSAERPADAALAQRLRRAVDAQPLTIRGERTAVRVSVGLAAGAADGDGARLVTRAIEELRVTKARRGPGLGGVASSATGSAERARLAVAVAGATTRGEIGVAFQPIVDLVTGRTHGFEALARWRHDDLGEVAPTDFVPVAEDNGEIVRIGEHVLHSACRQLARWRRCSDHELKVTVNISPVQLGICDIDRRVSSILDEHGLPGHALTLEITEGVFLSPGAAERGSLERIRRLGVQIALDDFGTGYSALGYLNRLPVDAIKVDRCFVEGVDSDERNAAVMRAILAIGSGMDLDVIAEGVETHAQSELLRGAGCRLGQGFLFSHPRPAEEIALAG
ncbi:MAG: bifunctional diguanylate cyclase/phosphodiesterase [Solirubrobacterales bacterium]|nr:bifunctional diguanylate cyclase/phosphodiesterase [Solirubrobacterales bacterium]